MFKVNNKIQQISRYFTPCSSTSIVYFEHVTVGWVAACSNLTTEVLEQGVKCVQS